MMWLRVKAPQVTRVPRGFCSVQATEKKCGFPPQLRPYGPFALHRFPFSPLPCPTPSLPLPSWTPAFRTVPQDVSGQPVPPPSPPTHTTGAVHTQQPSSFFLQPWPHDFLSFYPRGGHTLPNCPAVPSGEILSWCFSLMWAVSGMHLLWSLTGQPWMT